MRRKMFKSEFVTQNGAAAACVLLSLCAATTTGMKEGGDKGNL